jgi:hypothetical protein
MTRLLHNVPMRALPGPLPAFARPEGAVGASNAPEWRQCAAATGILDGVGTFRQAERVGGENYDLRFTICEPGVAS